MIKGKKTGLRAVEKSDLETLKDWRNNPKFRRNFREVRELNSVNQELWLERTNKSPNDFMFIIEDIETKMPIGAGGILYINWINRAGDFSFYIGYEEKYIDDEGYAEEAARLLLEYAYNNLNLNKIWMELYEFDEQKLTFFKEKFSFVVDGCLRENCYEDGKYWNSYIISLLKKEYK